MKKILFMGTPKYATKILNTILKSESFEVVGLVCQPDKVANRGKKLKMPDTKEYVMDKELDIKIFQPENLKNSSLIGSFRDLNPDYIVVAAYGQIVPKEIIDAFFCINLHASLLPKYRGASPIQEMILNQNHFVGISCMKMSYRLDDGDILSFRYLQNSDLFDFETLYERLGDEAGSLLIETLKNLSKIEPLKQLHCDSSYCKKIKKESALVSFDNAQELYIKSKAYCGWPNIHLQCGLKIFNLRVVELDSTNKCGEIIDIGKNSITVGCQKGSLEIFHLQAPSKQRVDAASYIRGKRLKVGDTIS